MAFPVFWSQNKVRCLYSSKQSSAKNLMQNTDGIPAEVNAVCIQSPVIRASLNILWINEIYI